MKGLNLYVAGDIRPGRAGIPGFTPAGAIFDSCGQLLPRRRAHRRDMVVGQSQTLAVQRVQVGGLQNRISMCGHLWITLIVGHHDNNVRACSGKRAADTNAEHNAENEQSLADNYESNVLHFLTLATVFFLRGFLSSTFSLSRSSLTSVDGHPSLGTSTLAVQRIAFSTTLRKLSFCQLL